MSFSYDGMASYADDSHLSVTLAENQARNDWPYANTSADPAVTRSAANAVENDTADLQSAVTYHGNITAANQALLPRLVSSAETGRSNRNRTRAYAALEGGQGMASHSADVRTMPQPSMRSSDVRDPPSATSTARSSYDTINTRGTSMNSTDSVGSAGWDNRRFSDETALTAPVAAPSALVQGPSSRASGTLPSVLAQQPRYLFCPPCNMGSGTSSTGAASSGPPTSDQLSKRPTKAWLKPGCFDKHVRGLHEGLFKRAGTAEFICPFCSCISLWGFNCHGRFLTFPDLLVHLKATHAQNTEELMHYHHCCGPLSFNAQSSAMQG